MKSSIKDFFSKFDQIRGFRSLCETHGSNVSSTSKPISTKTVSKPVRIVRKSVVSCRTASPVDFDIVMETINVTLLCTYRCVFFKIPY